MPIHFTGAFAGPDRRRGSGLAGPIPECALGGGLGLHELRNRIEPHISRVAVLCGCSLHGLSG